MTALLGVEVRRLLARRLVRVVALMCLAGIVVAGTIVFLRSGRPGQGFALTDLRSVASETSGLLVLIGWIVGASAIGAEWHAGTVTTALTWEPRRVRLLLVKALAVALLVFAGALVLQLLLGGALVPSAMAHGSTRGVDASWLTSTAGIVLRSSAVTALAALLGFCVASIARHTAAALGIAFGLTAVAEPLLVVWRPGWQRWTLNRNMAVFVSGRDLGFPPLDQTIWDAGLVLLLYGAVAIALALLMFTRRDVT